MSADLATHNSSPAATCAVVRVGLAYGAHPGTEPLVPPSPLDRSAPTLVAGHCGRVSGAVRCYFRDAGFTFLVTATSAEFDLREREAVETNSAAERPATVV